VLEIGAGLGSLTLALAETGAEVTAIEVDRHLVPLLRENVEPAGVTVIEADALEADWSEILVIVVLVAFLRSGRLAAISLTAIPLSILAAVLILVWRGISINGMTLGGLAIAVGEVVDDAIVDVENVWRRLRENARADHPRAVLDVIHDASLEIRGSVVYASMIVILVLIPVLLLGGVAGHIFSPLAQAYMLAIGASLLVALTVTPAMCAWLLPALPLDRIESTALATRLLERYRRILHAATARPRPTRSPASSTTPRPAPTSASFVNGTDCSRTGPAPASRRTSRPGTESSSRTDPS